MMKLFKKLDQYLLLNHPLLWSIQLHRLLLWWIPAMAILMGLFSLTDVSDYDRSMYSLVAPWLSIIMIFLLVLWLIYLLRFNSFKQFGKQTPLFELKNFFFIFIGMLLITLFAQSLNITRYLKIRTVYPKSTISRAVMAGEMLSMYKERNETVSQEVCSTYYKSDSEYQKALKKFRAVAKAETQSGGCVQFMLPANWVGLNQMSQFDSYYESFTNKKLGIDSQRLSKAYATLLAKNDSIAFYQEFAEAMNGIAPFKYDGKYLAIHAWDFKFDFQGVRNVGFNGTNRYNEEYLVSNEISNILENVLRYGYSRDASFLEGWQLRIIFYFAFFGTLLLIIFRNMTLKTFLISLGVGALMPLVVLLLMAVTGGIDGDKISGILLFLYLLFGFLSMLVFVSTTRNIFHGIALNLFTISTPLLGLLLVALWHESGGRDALYSYDTILERVEWIEIIFFLILLQPLFKTLYTRWYSLPEQ